MPVNTFPGQTDRADRKLRARLRIYLSFTSQIISKYGTTFSFRAFIHLLARIKVRPSASSNKLPCRQVVRGVFMRIGSPLIFVNYRKKKMAINQLAAALVLTVLSGSVLAASSSATTVTSKTGPGRWLN